jgi:hypothetical protein
MPGTPIPFADWHGALTAEDGSWDRRVRNEYQGVFVPFGDGSPADEPMRFLL